MVQQLTIQEYLRAAADYTVIDVRSQKEYSVGHIHGAVNIPMLEDDERKIVGTTFKQNGRQAAVYKGLELTGPHLSDRLRQAVKYTKNGKVLVHCWRGGMRSEFISFLLHFYGLEPYQLKGGYKSYRQSAHASFLDPLNITILAGKSGSAKTEILQLLKAEGEQIIDLEDLARHRGSSFGALAYKGHKSQEQFENDLFEVIRKLDPNRRLWVEDENRVIGDKVIPAGIWNQMVLAPRVIVERSFEERLERIVNDYAVFDKDDLKQSMGRIGKRLGPQHVKEALKFLDLYDYKSAFEIALKYYDKAYDYQLLEVPLHRRKVIEAVGIEINEVVKRLIDNDRE
jgi:tRNA 2-selenouridine synthase